MASPVADSYSVASGQTIYAGREAPASLPAWVPEPGTFANISLNTLDTVKPSGYGGETAGPFANWGGGRRIRDFGAYGALVVHGSGHLQTGSIVWQGSNVFDVETRLWTMRNLPTVNHAENVDLPGQYGEYADGSTYPPHTYTGLAEYPAAWGGGTQGSLLRFSYPGADQFANTKSVHAFDLSEETLGVTRVIDDVPLVGTFSNYMTVAMDESRQGYWVLAYNGNGPLQFVEAGTWEMAAYGVDFNENNYHCLIHVPAPYDCLVSIGRNATEPGVVGVYCSRIVNNVPQAFVKVSGLMTGDLLPDHRSGGVWSTLLNCIVSYMGDGTFDVYKLTLPADPDDLTTGAWVWSKEALTGVSGATPVKNTAGNGSHARLAEFPELQCFIWADSISGSVQAWRLTGM